MVKNKGKFIVFEGIDGAGGETQSKLLTKFLEKMNNRVLYLTYPDPLSPLGNLIEEYLKKMHEFSPETQFLIYAADMVKDIEKIDNYIKNGCYVIADRYITSTMAYQHAQGFSIQRILRFAKLFNMPKPDFVFYLKIHPRTGIERKIREKHTLDRNESNEKFLKNVAAVYNKLAKRKIFGKWVVINGEKSKEEVFEDVKRTLGL